MFENTSVAVMYAVSPCHAGSGSALGVVDLPIQRERHTNWPMIQSSGVKGAFRANFDGFKGKIAQKEQIADFEKLTDSVFGTSEGSGFAGAVSVSDAKILAYPMRSSFAPFVWITCPAVLSRFQCDLEIAGMEKFDPQKFCIKGEELALNLGAQKISGKVILEDYEVNASENAEVSAEFSKIQKYFADAKRILLVSDEVFGYGVSECTQIMAQIKIDQATGTTQDGSLRYQEELPADTVMYCVIHWSDSRNSAEKLQAETIRKFISEEVISSHIQIAGDETCGRGIFKLNWFHKGGGAE